MKIIIAVAALLLTATSASAMCLGTNCPSSRPDNTVRMLEQHQQRQEWNAIHGQQNNAPMQFHAPSYPPLVVPQGPGVLEILMGLSASARAQEEHELRMNLMQQQLERAKAAPAPASAPGMMSAQDVQDRLTACRLFMRYHYESPSPADRGTIRECQNSFPHEKF